MKARGSFYRSNTAERVSNLLTPKEILNFLDKRAGREFNRQVSNQIFEECGVDELQDIKLDTFIDTYSFAIATLKKRIAEVKEEQKRLTADIDNKRIELEQFDGEEPLDKGKMDLIIHVKKGVDLADYKDNYLVNAVLKIIVPGQRIKSTQPQKSKNPIWNQDFTFKVDQALESFDIELCHGDSAEEKSLGTATVYLWEFNSQEKKVKNVSFEAQNGEPLKGYAVIEINCISSYKKFYAQDVDQLQSEKQNMDSYLDDHKEDLVTLYLPFPDAFKNEE